MINNELKGNKYFFKGLKKSLKKAGYTQKTFADKLKVDIRTIWKFKNATIILATFVEKSDEYKNQNIKLIWYFFEKNKAKNWFKMIKEIEIKTADY